MNTLIIRVEDDDDLRPTLWSLTREPACVDFRVIVADVSNHNRHLQHLKEFSSRLNALWLQLNGNKADDCPRVADHVTGDVVLTAESGVIFWGDCLSHLVEKTKSTGHSLAAFSRVRSALAMQLLDDYGSNLDESLLQECPEADTFGVIAHPAEPFLLHRVPSHIIVSLGANCLTHPTASAQHLWNGDDNYEDVYHVGAPE